MSTISVPRILFVALVAAILGVGAAHPSNAEGGTATPQVFILDSKVLKAARDRLQSNDPAILPAFKKLIREADRALANEAFSVVQKDLAPPSGDKHDYMSIAPYWWPNPNTANGLPYVHRDGEVSPERDQVSDRKRLDNMIQAVKTLSLGYFFTRREEYAAQATKLVRVWFLAPATKMNPNLRYAQAIPGRNNGRGAGIIETHDLPKLIDAVGMLADSQAWDRNSQNALQDWFATYLAWLLDSPAGRAEAKAQNNHGSWYDVQVASYALFAGKNDVARNILNEFPTKRIAKQIEPDGRQPRELERTQVWNYSLFNLEALFDAASAADKLGMDLWNYETPDKRSIRRALDWLLPFAIGAKKWSYQQISAWQPETLAPLLRRAAGHYREPAYEKAISKLPGAFTDQRWQLLYSENPFEK
jgi:hypothetical protein